MTLAVDAHEPPRLGRTDGRQPAAKMPDQPRMHERDTLKMMTTSEIPIAADDGDEESRRDRSAAPTEPTPAPSTQGTTSARQDGGSNRVREGRPPS
jgi:hypothetical protein